MQTSTDTTRPNDSSEKRSTNNENGKQRITLRSTNETATPNGNEGNPNTTRPQGAVKTTTVVIGTMFRYSHCLSLLSGQFEVAGIGSAYSE